MSRTGTDLLSRPTSRSQPLLPRSSGLGCDNVLLALLGVVAVTWLGVLAYLLVTLGTALP